MYAIARGDINMSSGKLAAQTGHAFKMLTRSLIKSNKPRFKILENQYFSDGIGTNVILFAKDLNELLAIHASLDDQYFPVELIEDEGHIHPPHFDGSPIITCLGVGPAKKKDLPAIFSKLQSYK